MMSKRLIYEDILFFVLQFFIFIVLFSHSNNPFYWMCVYCYFVFVFNYY